MIDTRYNTDGTVFSQTKIAWTYDDDQRLTNETLTVLQGAANAPNPYSDTFRYDLSNNRLEEDIDEGDDGTTDAKVGYTYNGDDQLKAETRTGDGACATNYGYDNNGSLTNQVKTGTNPENDSYGYDARNRMVNTSTSVTDGSGTVTTTTASYGYDDNGVRVSEATTTTVTPVSGSTTTTSGTTYYLNNPQNPTSYTKTIEESATLNGSPTRAYVLGLNVIAQSDSSNGLLYLLKDGQGSTRALVHPNGSLAEQYNYNGFGTLLASTSAQSDAGAALTQWLYGGDGIYDHSTGWTYHLSRFVAGFRFTQLDPRVAWAGDTANADLYTFVGQNPLSWQDPLGRDIGSNLDFGLANLDVAEDIGGFAAVSRAFAYGVQKAVASEKQAWDEMDAEFSVYQAYTEAWKTITDNILFSAVGEILGAAGESFALANEGAGGGGAVVTQELEELGEVDSDAASIEEAAQSSDFAGCFRAGTPILLAHGLQNIETIRPGRRILTSETNSSPGTSIDPSQYRLVRLHLVKDCQEFQMAFLRPAGLLDGLGVGDTIELSVLELKLEGSAHILSIECCPPIEEGSGQIVTGIFRSQSICVKQLRVTDRCAKKLSTHI